MRVKVQYIEIWTLYWISYSCCKRNLRDLQLLCGLIWFHALKAVLAFFCLRGLPYQVLVLQPLLVSWTWRCWCRRLHTPVEKQRLWLRAHQWAAIGVPPWTQLDYSADHFLKKGYAYLLDENCSSRSCLLSACLAEAGAQCTSTSVHGRFCSRTVCFMNKKCIKILPLFTNSALGDELLCHLVMASSRPLSFGRGFL